MDPRPEATLDALLAAAASGAPAAAPAGVVSGLLLADERAATAPCPGDALTNGELARLLTHAGVAAKQLERLLLEVQSAAALCPAAAQRLLRALDRQHRRRLAASLGALQLPQQQQEQQQQPSLVATQLQQLGVWDVLLVTAVWSQQLEADASLVLLQGVQDASSPQQLPHLFRGLAATAQGAAEWLLGVGLVWASTCHLDVPQGFEEAGVALLQAGLLASPQLASAGLRRLLQQLATEALPCSRLWAVLEHVTAACCLDQRQPSQGQLQAAQQAQQAQACPCSLDAATQQAGAVARACQAELLAGLASVVPLLQQRHPALAVRYARLLGPLASVSLGAAAALLQAAARALHAQPQPQPLKAVKAELEGSEAPDAAAAVAVAVAAAAAAAAAADVQADLDKCAGGPGLASAAAGATPATLIAGQQQPSAARRKPRYSWGAGRLASASQQATPQRVSSLQTPLAFASRHADQGAARTAHASATPAGEHGGAAAGEAQPAVALPAAADGEGPLPLLSPAVGLEGAAQLLTPASLAATPAVAAAGSALQGQQAPPAWQPGATAKRMQQLLRRVQRAQHRASSRGSVPAAAASPQPPVDQQVAVALTVTALRCCTPCRSLACQQPLTQGLTQVLQGLPVEALQQLLQQQQEQQQQPWPAAGMLTCWRHALLQQLVACTQQAPSKGDEAAMQQRQGSESAAAVAAASEQLGAAVPVLLMALRHSFQAQPDAAQQQELAGVLSQLLQRLLAAGGPPGAAASTVAAPLQLAAEAQQQPLRWHALSVLLSWLLEQAELAEQVCAAAAASCAGAVTAAEPSEGSCGAALQPLLLEAALLLQQLQQHTLPHALRQLLAAHAAADAAAAEAAAGAAQQALATPHHGGALAVHEPPRQQQRRQKQARTFFVLQAATPQHAQAAAGWPGAADGSPPTSSLHPLQHQQLPQLPSWLLEPPVLWLPACMRLLAAAHAAVLELQAQLHDAGAASAQHSPQAEQPPSSRLRARRHPSEPPRSKKQPATPGASLAPAAAAAAAAAAATPGAAAAAAAGAAAACEGASLQPAVELPGTPARPATGDDSAAQARTQRCLQLADLALASTVLAAGQLADGGGAGRGVRCMTAVLDTAALLVQLSTTLNSEALSAALGTPGPAPQLQPELLQQRLAHLAGAARSAAAQLLQHWWRTQGSVSGAGSVEALNHLLQLLLADGQAATGAGSSKQHSSAVAAGLSHREVLGVLHGELGSATWAALKRLTACDQLLAVLLVLVVRLQQQLQLQARQPPGHAGTSAHAAAAADVPAMFAAGGVVAAELQLLAVLRSIAEAAGADTSRGSAAQHATEAAAASGRTSRPSHGSRGWLLGLLDDWLVKQVVLGPALNPLRLGAAAPVPTLVTLAATCGPSSLRNLALCAHWLALHHGPSVHAATAAKLWGRAVAPEAHPAWVQACEQRGALAATRQLVRCLLDGLDGSTLPSAAPAAGDAAAAPAAAAPAAAAPAAGDAAAAPAAGDAAATPAAGDAAAAPAAGQQPCEQAVLLLRAHTAAVAALCDCAGLLLRGAQEQRQHVLSRQQDGQDSGDDEPTTGSNGAGGGSDVQLAVRALASCLAGPCCSAARALRAWLQQREQLWDEEERRWQEEQAQLQPLQGPQQPGQEAAAAAAGQLLHVAAAVGAGAGAAADVVAAAGAAAGAHSDVPQQRCLPHRQPRKGGRRRGAAGTKERVAFVELQGLLLGLGHAAGQIVLRLLQQQAQQQQPAGGGSTPAAATWLQQLHALPGGRDDVALLQQRLRGFSAACQALYAAVDASSTRQGPYGPAAELAGVLERCMAAAASQRRLDARAAVAAAAAAAGAPGSDSEADEPGAQGPGGAALERQRQQEAAAARFADPDVREELPYAPDAAESSDQDADEPAVVLPPRSLDRAGAAARPLLGGEPADSGALDALQQQQRRELFGWPAADAAGAAGTAAGHGAAGERQRKRRKLAASNHAVADASGQLDLGAPQQGSRSQPGDGTAAAAAAAARAASAATLGAAAGGAPRRHSGTPQRTLGAAGLAPGAATDRPAAQQPRQQRPAGLKRLQPEPLSSLPQPLPPPAGPAPTRRRRGRPPAAAAAQAAGAGGGVAGAAAPTATAQAAAGAATPARRRQAAAAEAPAGDAGSAQARNAYVQACLREDARRGHGAPGRGRGRPQRAGAEPPPSDGDGSDSESGAGGSDFSDLEDFIVCETGTDYARLCAEVGGRVTWKRAWKGGPPAARRGGPGLDASSLAQT